MEEEKKEVVEEQKAPETSPVPEVNVSEMNEEEVQLEKADAKYDAENIQVLEGLEAVRKRPGMYIGTTSSAGLHHLVWEIVDNAIDEALAGYCTEVKVTINPGDTITVVDNGRGIPVDVVKKSGLSGVETVYTVLHAGGKFGEGGGYKVSGGLHGVGASVVNALSEWCEVTVHKDGGVYYIKFVNGGKIVEHLKKIGTCDPDKNGTTVTFKPDAQIFTDTTHYDYETIRDRMRQVAYLNRGIKIIVEDAREAEPVHEEFCYKGGIKEYVLFINNHKTKLFDDVIYCEGTSPITLASGNEAHVYAEIAMQYDEVYEAGRKDFCSEREGVLHIDIPTLQGKGQTDWWLYRILSDFGFNADQLAQIERSLDALSGKEFLSPTHRRVKDRRELRIYPLPGPGDGDLTARLDVRTFSVPAGFDPKQKPEDVLFVDADLVRLPLSARPPREGDRFRPFGMHRGTKLLSDFFTDLKLDVEQKRREVVVTRQKENGDEVIVAILGRRIDDRFKVTAATRAVAAISWIPPQE